MLSINHRLFTLVSLSLYILLVVGDEVLLKDEGIDRGAHSDRSGLWFGPRLGKRSPPTEDERDILQRLLEAAANLKFEGELYERQRETDSKDADARRSWLRKIPPGFFTPRPGRSQKERPDPRRRYNNNVDFTPRLGRGLSDDLTDEELARYYAMKANINPDFTPRLGRQLAGYTDSVRVVRSVNRTKS